MRSTLAYKNHVVGLKRSFTIEGHDLVPARHVKYVQQMRLASEAILDQILRPPLKMKPT